MADTVRLRPNHYEVLGLAPGASSDEIEEAFAKELRLLPLRPFGNLANVSIAYETLRDPAKRAAYDESIRPPPEPSHPLIGRLEGAPFVARPSAEPLRKAVAIPSPPAPPRAPAWPESLAGRRTAPSATALLHQPRTQATREVAPAPAPKPEEARRPEPAEGPRLASAAADDRARPRLVAADERAAPADWKLPALAGGAMVLAVAVGAWTGLEAGNDEQAESNRIAVLKIPPAKAPAAAGAPQQAEVAAAAARAPEQRPRPATAESGLAPSRAALPADLLDERLAEAPQAEVKPEVLATEQAAVESPAVATGAARLPLPNAVVARTIGRIGYACGEVASVTPMEGAGSGTFRVTCTSGHSYRAAPVGGRYRFKRLGGR